MASEGSHSGSASSTTADSVTRIMRAQRPQSAARAAPRQALTTTHALRVVGVVVAARVDPAAGARTFDLTRFKLYVQEVGEPAPDAAAAVHPTADGAVAAVDLRACVGAAKAGSLAYSPEFPATAVTAGCVLALEANRGKGKLDPRVGQRVVAHVRVRGFYLKTGDATTALSAVALEPAADAVGPQQLRRAAAAAATLAPAVDYPADAPYGGYPVPGPVVVPLDARARAAPQRLHPHGPFRAMWASAGVAEQAPPPEEGGAARPVNVSFVLDVLGHAGAAPGGTTEQRRVTERVAVWPDTLQAIPGLPFAECARLLTAPRSGTTALLFYWGGVQKDAAKKAVWDARGPTTEVGVVAREKCAQQGITLTAGTAVTAASGLMCVVDWAAALLYGEHAVLLPATSELVQAALATAAPDLDAVSPELEADVRARAPGTAVVACAQLQGVEAFDPDDPRAVYVLLARAGPIPAPVRAKLMAKRLDDPARDELLTLAVPDGVVVVCWPEAEQLAHARALGRLPGPDEPIPAPPKQKRKRAARSAASDAEPSPKRRALASSEAPVDGNAPEPPNRASPAGSDGA